MQTNFILKSAAVVFVLIFILVFVAGLELEKTSKNLSFPQVPPLWTFRSVDTMKYSRDVAREKLKDSSYDKIIDQQVKNIAATGASHIAIGTPYDSEFLPFLKRWVAAARKYKLHVWFRGNWSGWEGWFGFAKISPEEHLAKTREFLSKNADLFEDGDVFTACPECENGGPGDPRQTGKVTEHRHFLISEYNMMQEIFKKTDKKVIFNYNSMNGDIARLIMDKDTTRSLGGVVVIDHYVKTPEKLVKDVKDFAGRSGGRVVLGEFGAPIPDIHGDLSDKEQADWIRNALSQLSEVKELEGINYWVSVGGSTQIWNDNGSPREAVAVVRSYFSPDTVSGQVRDEVGKIPENLSVMVGGKSEILAQGNFRFISRNSPTVVIVAAPGHKTQTLKLNHSIMPHQIILEKERESLWFRFLKFVKDWMGK